MMGGRSCSSRAVVLQVQGWLRFMAGSPSFEVGDEFDCPRTGATAELSWYIQQANHCLRALRGECLRQRLRATFNGDNLGWRPCQVAAGRIGAHLELPCSTRHDMTFTVEETLSRLLSREYQSSWRADYMRCKSLLVATQSISALHNASSRV